MAIRKEEKKVNKVKVAFKCTIMTFVWTAVFYWWGYWVVLGVKYLAENFTMEQIWPWFLLVGVFVVCAAVQIENYDREVYPEKYLEEEDSDD